MAPPAAPHLHYRDYVDADDEPCKALEMRALQGTRFPKFQKFAQLFLRAGFEHLETFDAKSRQFEDSIIRVVEDKASAGRVVAVGCAAVKTARMHSQMCKIAYVFDLRVDEDYQGHGIGKTLSAQIEEKCEARGIHYLYLTVNDDNTKAKSLYAKQGFVHASHRSPALSLLASPQQEEVGISVQCMPREEAMRTTAEAYKSADLVPQQLDELFESHLYEGTFVARHGSSFAGVSTWNGSFITGIKIERLLLPMSWWRRREAGAAVVASSAFAAWCWLGALLRAGAHAAESRDFIDLITFISMIALTTASAVFVWKAWPVLQFVVRKVLSTDTKMRHRLFAPFAGGPKDEQEKLMGAIVKHVHNVARKSGYGLTICNMDKNHPLRNYFPGSKFTTTFLYKPIGTHSSKECHPLSVDSFFDPRDL